MFFQYESTRQGPLPGYGVVQEVRELGMGKRASQRASTSVLKGQYERVMSRAENEVQLRYPKFPRLWGEPD